MAYGDQSKWRNISWLQRNIISEKKNNENGINMKKQWRNGWRSMWRK